MAWVFKFPKDVQTRIKSFTFEPTPSARAIQAFEFHFDTFTEDEIPYRTNPRCGLVERWLWLEPRVSGATWYRPYIPPRNCDCVWPGKCPICTNRPLKLWLDPYDYERRGVTCMPSGEIREIQSDSNPSVEKK